MRFFVFLLFSACASMTSPKFNRDVWLHEVIPTELCMRYPDIQDFGIYRVLSNGNKEYLMYCDAQIQNYISSHVDDVIIERKDKAQ